MSLRIRRREIWVPVLVCIMAASATASTARRAVLVGINDYSASELSRAGSSAPVPGRFWPRLKGAVNDVHMMREMLLARYGFSAADIVFLQDQAATRDAILAAIESQLVEPSAPGDVAFFYYAGHGSQVLNLFSDEPDKLDESIVPADSRLGAPDIRDKELRRLFNRVLDKRAHLTIILDSCHSGSGTRFPSGAVFRHVKSDRRDVADKLPFGPPLETRGALVIAGAQDFETAGETEDDREQPVGVFSWAWIRALRDAAPGEPARDTFLRAQARMRLERPSQNPVLSADADMRLRPFLDAQRDRLAERDVVAIEAAPGDGSVVLQGGWANALSEGTLLRPSVGGAARVRITRLDGLARSAARITIPPEPGEPPLRSGTLLEVVSWAAPPGKALRVWMPRANGTAQSQVHWAAELAQAAARRNVRWIEDPIDHPPAYVVRFVHEHWELLSAGQAPESLPTSDPATLLARIPPGASLFAQLPTPVELLDRIRLGPGTAWSGIEPLDQPERADYFLTGRFVRGHLEYAWVRPDAAAADGQHAPMPLRTTWCRTADLAVAASELIEDVVRLRKIQAWGDLTSPASGLWPYRLVVEQVQGSRPVEEGVLVNQEQYGLVLRSKSARPPAAVDRRYVYVFAIDSFGRAFLLFGHDSVENRFPLSATDPPFEIPLGPRASFAASPPFGTDTFFLLTTAEPLPDPSILEWDGVHKRGAPRSPLEELIALLQAGRRSASNIAAPPVWSIDRLAFETRPAGTP